MVVVENNAMVLLVANESLAFSALETCQHLATKPSHVEIMAKSSLVPSRRKA